MPLCGPNGRSGAKDTPHPEDPQLGMWARFLCDCAIHPPVSPHGPALLCGRGFLLSQVPEARRRVSPHPSLQEVQPLAPLRSLPVPMAFGKAHEMPHAMAQPSLAWGPEAPEEPQKPVQLMLMGSWGIWFLPVRSKSCARKGHEPAFVIVTGSQAQRSHSRGLQGHRDTGRT